MDGARRSAARVDSRTSRLRTGCTLGNGLRFGCFSSFVRPSYVPRVRVSQAVATKVMPQSRKRKNNAVKLKKQKAASVCASSLLLVLYCFEGPTYDVTSHQFLLISLKMKNARPFSSSRFHNSLIPICLPWVENSLCASSTSSGLATFRVKRLAADK